MPALTAYVLGRGTEFHVGPGLDGDGRDAWFDGRTYGFPDPAAPWGCAWIAVPPATVEVVLGVAFALLASRQPMVGVLLAWCWLAVHGASVALLDVVVRRVPNILTLPAYGGVTALLTAAAMVAHDTTVLFRAVSAGIASAGFYGLIALTSRGGLGMGDVKLAISLGTALGWVGVASVVVGTLLGLLVAAVYGFTAVTAGKMRRQAHFALGPFLILGTFLVLVIGE